MNDPKIIKTIIEGARERFPAKGASERLDASPDHGALLPVIMRDAGRAEVLDYFITRLTGEYDIRFDEPKGEELRPGPVPVDQYLNQL
jgi:hypothetical protein